MARLKIDLSPEVRHLEVVTRNNVSSKFIGNYKSVFKGQGLEFESYSAYTPNDDASVIDWKASVRANNLLVKQFVEERNLNIFFLVDASSSMLLGSTHRLKSEYAGELVASFAYASISSGDCVGFSLFTDRSVKDVYPINGAEAFYNLSRTIVNPALYGGPFNMSAALRFLLMYLNKGDLVMIVSDFIVSQGGDWEPELKMAAQKFDIIGVMLRDPVDQKMPSGMGLVRLRDPFSEKEMIVAPNAVKAGFDAEARKQVSRVRSVFVKNNCDFIYLETNKSFIKPLTDLFMERSRKWR